MAVKLTVTPPGTSGVELAYTFDQDKIVIGRGAGADVRLPSPTVSEQHCVIRLEGQDYVLFDPGSTNGTRHNGQVLVEGRRKLLRSGDTIGIAGFSVGFRAGLAMQGVHNAERTAALARRMVREALGVVGPGAEPPRLTFVNGNRAGQRLPVPESADGIVFGRDLTCDVRLDDSDASRKHAAVRRTWEGVTLVDLGAKNPLLVNEVPVQGERRLRDRDEILVGATRLVFEDPAEAFLRELELLERDAVLPETRPGVARSSEPPGDADRGEGAPEPGPAPAPAEREAARPVAPAHDRHASTEPIRTDPGGSRLADLLVVFFGIAILVGAIAALVLVLD